MTSISFDSMPDDVLLYIFLLGIQDDFESRGEPEIFSMPLNISHTNRAFRRLALSSPSLWSILYITIGLNLDEAGEQEQRTKARGEGLLRLWVERSGNALLNYHVEFHNSKLSKNVLEPLLREKHRWQSITLRIYSNTDPDFHLELSDMPYLRKLDLLFNVEKRTEKKITLDLSSSKQLRYLSMERVKGAQWRDVLETIQAQKLTELLICPTDDGNHQDPYLFTSLGTFYNLINLDIRNIGTWFEVATWNDIQVQRNLLVLLPKLRTLFLGQGCAQLINYLNTPSLVSLDIGPMTHEGRFIHEFLERSRPQLKTMGLRLYHLKTNVLIHILQLIPSLETFEIIQEPGEKSLANLWSILTIKNSSANILLPNLTALIFTPFSHQEAIRKRSPLGKMLKSRRRYSKNFQYRSGCNF